MATNHNNKKKIWVLVRRYDIAEAGRAPPERLFEVAIYPTGDSEVTQQVLSKVCQLPRNTVVFKMRNHRGSLIPLNGNIPPNARSIPYTLEVVRIHQNIQPQRENSHSPRSAQAVRHALDRINYRLQTLEEAAGDLKTRRNQKIEEDMADLATKLKFLNQRFHEAEKTRWEGMFKRNPLW